MNVLASLKRPFSARTLPGLFFVLVPIMEFFAMGYKLACASSAMRGEYELPDWKNWKQLFLFGLGARVIQALWLAPAALVFLLLWSRLKALQALQGQLALETLGEFIAIKNLLIAFLLLLAIAAIFSPASVLNYIAEARFAKAFSFSALKRMAGREYFLGLLIAGAYSSAALAIFLALALAVGNFVQASPMLAGIIVLLAELFILWFSGITIWSLLGEAWGKVLQREYYGRYH